MNGHDAHERFYEALIEACARVVAPMGADRVVERFRLAMASALTSGKMTIKAGALVAQKSVRQLYVHKKAGEEERPAASVWRSLLEVLSRAEWTPFDTLLVRLSRSHGDLSRRDLEKVLRFYVERGWLEQDGREQYRLSPVMVSTCEDVQDRLERATAALPAMLDAGDGFMLRRPGAALKVIDLEGTQADLDRFLASFDAWSTAYFQTNPLGDGQRFRVVLAAAGVNDSPGIPPRKKGRQDGS